MGHSNYYDQPHLNTLTAEQPPADIIYKGMQNATATLVRAIQSGDDAAMKKAAAHFLQTSGGPAAQASAILAAAQKDVASAAFPYGPGGGCCLPNPEQLICGREERDWRRPIISQTKAAGPITVAPGDSFMADIFAGLFPTAASREFLLADSDEFRPQVLGRVCVGIGIRWLLFVQEQDGTPAIVQILDQEDLKPFYDALNLVTAQIFRTASSEPWMDTTPAHYFGEQGKQLPDSIMKGSVFYDKRSRIQLNDPAVFPDLTVPATNTNSYIVNVSVTVDALFIDPELAKGVVPQYNGN